MQEDATSGGGFIMFIVSVMCIIVWIYRRIRGKEEPDYFTYAQEGERFNFYTSKGERITTAMVRTKTF